MKFSHETIRAAFDQLNVQYQSKPSWDVNHHFELWDHAQRAFDGAGSPEDFGAVYGQLQSHWQVFRKPNGACWSADQTHTHLLNNAPRWRNLSLLSLTDQHVPDLYDLVVGMRGLKPIKHGVSVMAISKFLHFMNPRLFVIVDDALMWQWVFAHNWIWTPVLATRERVASQLDCKDPVGERCDPLSYLAILRWSADVLDHNPEILVAFHNHLKRHRRDDSGKYACEAAAIEWFLLGLVELPPAGVSFN